MNQTGHALSYFIGGLRQIRGCTKLYPDCSADSSREEIETMDDGPVWEKISTAPYNLDLELAVIEQDRVYPLVFACRRTASGWIKVPSMDRVVVSPTHWRPWPGAH